MSEETLSHVAEGISKALTLLVDHARFHGLDRLAFQIEFAVAAADQAAASAAKRANWSSREQTRRQRDLLVALADELALPHRPEHVLRSEVRAGLPVDLVDVDQRDLQGDVAEWVQDQASPIRKLSS